MRNDALFQLGMDLEAQVNDEPRRTTQTEDYHSGSDPWAAKSNIVNFAHQRDDRLDHFIVKNGETCAGTHLIIDLYGAERLDDLEYIQDTMLNCVNEAGATLLHIHLHPFEPNGVSGVAVLAESHISVHTWPETGYAAFDVFMCGQAQPEKCIDILSKAFRANRTEVAEHLRGNQIDKS